MKKNLLPLAILVIWAVIQAACNFPLFRGSSSPTPNVLNTAAAMTVQSFSSQVAATHAAQTVLPYTTTTLWPTMSVQTSIPQGSATPTQQKTPCNAAAFMADVTIPDDTTLLPGTAFNKVWRLKNIGSCTWDSSYALTFANEGNAMGSPASKNLDNISVKPGDTVNVSIPLTAPNQEGDYKGVWKLRDSSGETFGKFWVQIKVTSQAADEYIFVDNLCSAEWYTGAGTLQCPGKEGDEKGYVIRIAEPRFETAYQDNEPAMVTFPQSIENGEIVGTFFPIIVPENAHFRSVIGCMHKAESCKVKFILKYKIEGSDAQTLGEWDEAYDDHLTNIDIDLVPYNLTDKKVSFIFIVKANGSPTQDQAFWLKPRVGK